MYNNFNKKQILIFYKDNPIRSFKHSLNVLNLKTTKTFQKNVMIISISHTEKKEEESVAFFLIILKIDQ